VGQIWPAKALQLAVSNVDKTYPVI